jgi:hypothetical protein
LQSSNPNIYSTITLENVLYIPRFPLNIVSGQRHYANGGAIVANKLFSKSRQLLATLNFEKSGFFLIVKGQPEPVIPRSWSIASVALYEEECKQPTEVYNQSLSEQAKLYTAAVGSSGGKGSTEVKALYADGIDANSGSNPPINPPKIPENLGVGGDEE